MDAQRFQGVLGVYDDDQDRLENDRPEPSMNLIRTDCCDLESFLLRSGGLQFVLAEYGNPASIQEYERLHGNVEQALLRLGSPLGRLRWLSRRLGLGLDFKKLHSSRFISSDWILDRPCLLQAASAQCQRSSTDLEVEMERLPVVDPWDLCQGKDLIDILEIGLARDGALGFSKSGKKDIGGILRASLSERAWRESSLHAGILAWETRNKGFKIMRNSPA